MRNLNTRYININTRKAVREKQIIKIKIDAIKNTLFSEIDLEAVKYKIEIVAAIPALCVPGYRPKGLANIIIPSYNLSRCG